MEINPETDLMFERVVDCPVELVWAAWTKPEHLVHWFTPKPWKTTKCEIDLRPGGRFFTVMESPEGDEHPGTGCYLEVVENERLVWTDFLRPGFGPAEDGFMTGAVELERRGDQTLYRAYALHSDAEARKRHEEMGFEHGWGAALDQLVDYMKSM